MNKLEVNDLRLKAIVDKTKRLEEAFHKKHSNDFTDADELLDSAITIMRMKGNIITELNRKIDMLQQELLIAYEDGLNSILEG